MQPEDNYPTYSSIHFCDQDSYIDEDWSEEGAIVYRDGNVLIPAYGVKDNPKCLVIFTGTWEHSFCLDSLWLINKFEYDQFLESLDNLKIDRDSKIYLSPAVYIDFASKEELLKHLKVHYISESLYNELIYKIGVTFGQLIIPNIVQHYERKD